MSTEMAWVKGLQDKEDVLQGCWTVKQYLLHGPGGYDSTASGLDLRKRVKRVHMWTSRLEGASESNPFTWPPPHIFRPPYFPDTRALSTYKRTDTLPCVRPCVSWCPGLWHLLCVACDRLEMWQLSLCQTKSGQSHNTHKHSHLQTLHRGSTAGLVWRR